MLWTVCLVGDFFVYFCFLCIVGKGIVWFFYWHNQKCSLILMMRSVDGVIFMCKIPKAPGDTVLNPSRTESIFNLQSHIDQIALCDAWFRPLKWQYFLFYLESKVAGALFLKERSSFCEYYEQVFQYYVVGKCVCKIPWNRRPPTEYKILFLWIYISFPIN